MELRGNAPFIVFEDADLEKAAEGAINTKFRNTGQMRTCSNRIYIQKPIKKEFLEIFKNKVKRLKVGNSLDEKTEIGPLISQNGIDKVVNHLKDAVNKGAKIVYGGEYLEREDLDSGYYFSPTLLSDVDDNMLIADEETFGPIAPIFTFETEEEVIERANNTEYGLASYFYTKNLNRAIRVYKKFEYGMVGLNDPALTAVQPPFGGVKESGIGREGGPESLKDFTETKFISIKF